MRYWLSLFSLLIFLVSFVFSTEAAVPLRKVVMVIAGFNEHRAVLFVAKDMRFFEEQGIDMQIVQVRSGQLAVSALAANEAQFYAASATGANLGAMASGLDLVFVAGLVNKLDGDFIATPNIAEPRDLKQKVLGIQSIGGGVWTFTMLALDHWGLNPERDKIQLRIIGDQAVLTQALIGGTIDAVHLSHAFSKVAQRSGFRVLADFAKMEIPYQGIGIVARRSFLDRSPDLAERTLRALSKAVVYFKNPENGATVAAIMMKWLRLPQLNDAVAGYESIRPLYSTRIVPTVEGLRNTLRILGRADGKFKTVKAEDLIDDRVVRKLQNENIR